VICALSSLQCFDSWLGARNGIQPVKTRHFSFKTSAEELGAQSQSKAIMHVCIAQTAKSSDALVEAWKQVSIQSHSKHCHSQRHNLEACSKRVPDDCAGNCKVSGAEYCSCSLEDKLPCISEDLKGRLLAVDTTVAQSSDCYAGDNPFKRSYASNYSLKSHG